jgi:GT2 family glycosyltransferase
MPSSARLHEKKITVIIPNWNGINWLGACLESLKQQDMADFHTIIVDNGSTDGSLAFISKNYPEVEIIDLPTNSGFANAANIGIQKSMTPYIVLLNADTQVYPNWLSSLTKKIDNSPPEVVALNSQLLRLENPERVDDAGDELSWYGAATKRGHGHPATDYQEEADILSPCAAASLYRRDFLLKTGGFDPDMFAYLEDVDLGLRGRLLGYRYLYCPQAKVLHRGQGAGMLQNRYVELITCNRLLLFVKNMPARLFMRHAMQILYGQLYFFILHRKPWWSLKGYRRFIVSLRATIKKRHRVMQSVSLELKDINTLLHERAPQPSLRNLITQYFLKIVSEGSNLLQRKLARRG